MWLQLTEDEQSTLALVTSKINEHTQDIDLENPASGTRAKELDGVSLHEYCHQEFQSELITGLLNVISQSLLGIETKDISALSFLHFCKSGTGFESVISDGKNGAQYLRIRQGTT